MPKPRKAIMLFMLAILPIAFSAFMQYLAACIDEYASGIDRHTARIVSPIAGSYRPIIHPNSLANSIKITMIPATSKIDSKNVIHPFQYLGGGVRENSSFQPIVQKCKNQLYQGT